MTKISKHLKENFDKLGKYVDLNNDDQKNAIAKYIARHLLKHTSLENPSIANFYANAFVEISREHEDKKIEDQAEIADPEYINHAGTAPAIIY